MKLKLPIFLLFILTISLTAISESGSRSADRARLQEQKLPDDNLVIPSIDEKWGKVKFTHQQHIPFSDCTYCHHSNKGLTLESFNAGKSERIPLCAECHFREEGNPKTAKNADGIELWSKEAYHINCIDCHKGEITRMPKEAGAVKKQGEGPTKCAACHEVKE